MTRTCTICHHRKRQDIDRELVGRTLSYRNIAAQYNVSTTAVSRHVKEHLPELLVRAHAAAMVADADELLSDGPDLLGEGRSRLLPALSFALRRARLPSKGFHPRS